MPALDERDIFDLGEPDYDLTGSRLAALRLALRRREMKRRERAARTGIFRWFRKRTTRKEDGVDIVNETGEEVQVEVEVEGARPTREEVLEGLRQVVGPGLEPLPKVDEAAVRAAIAYLEGLPTPGRIWVNLDEAGFHADMFDRKNLNEIDPDDRAAFLRALGGL